MTTIRVFMIEFSTPDRIDAGGEEIWTPTYDWQPSATGAETLASVRQRVERATGGKRTFRVREYVRKERDDG